MAEENCIAWVLDPNDPRAGTAEDELVGSITTTFTRAAHAMVFHYGYDVAAVVAGIISAAINFALMTDMSTETVKELFDRSTADLPAVREALMKFIKRTNEEIRSDSIERMIANLKTDNPQ